MAFAGGEWKPTNKQELFISIPWSIKEAFFGGGKGGGKSDLLLVLPLIWRLYLNPRFKQLFLRRTHQELRKEIVPRSREAYLRFGATYNGSDWAWTFPREDQYGSGYRNAGAMVFLGHCEHEKDVFQYDSMEINLFTPDEVQSLTEYIYTYIAFTRVRTSDPTLPAITRGAGMPGNVGHTFTKKRFVDPAPKGNVRIIGKGGNVRVYIHATLLDNPHIDPGYRQQIEQLPEAERKAALGDWNAYLGQVFSEFRALHYAEEPANALHVIPPFDIPAWWPRYIVIDWGFRAMCHIAWYAVSPSKRVYIYREMGFLKTKIEVWAPDVRFWIEKEQPRKVKVCQSAKQDRGQEHTIQEQIEKGLGVPVELSNNSPGSRVAGKMLIHEYLRWEQKKIIPADEIPEYNDEYAMWILRNKGLEDYKAYLSIFVPPEPETNLPKLQIFKCDQDHPEGHGHPNCCPLIIEAVQACVYAKTEKDKPAEDVAEFPGDDPYDNLRYGLDEAERFFLEAIEEFELLKKQQELTDKLAHTQDWTAFYNQARKIESDSDDEVKPVARYRH